jgi:RNA polymerase primary sigma factor
MNKQLVKWRRATAELQDKLDRNPTNEEIAASLKLSMKQLNITKRAIRIYNASPQTHPREEGRSIDETLMDDNALAPETNILMEDDLQQVMDLLSKMDKREGAVLRLRFGLGGEEPKTLREIGECLGLTSERVRQIESEALCKLSESVQAS